MKVSFFSPSRWANNSQRLPRLYGERHVPQYGPLRIIRKVDVVEFHTIADIAPATACKK